jgi:hypothetical protein
MVDDDDGVDSRIEQRTELALGLRQRARGRDLTFGGVLPWHHQLDLV